MKRYEHRHKPRGGVWSTWSVEPPAAWIIEGLIMSHRRITIHYDGQKSQWRRVEPGFS